MYKFYFLSQCIVSRFMGGNLCWRGPCKKAVSGLSTMTLFTVTGGLEDGWAASYLGRYGAWGGDNVGAGCTPCF